MAPNQAEVPWVDAWIRWERNSKQCDDDSNPLICDNNSDDDDDDESLPPPTESYDFTHQTPQGEITVKIEGYHSDSEQIWNSTGLTLWRSSYYLCQFLVDHYDEMLLPSLQPNNSCCNQGANTTRGDDCKQMKILEVGSGLGRCGILAHLLSKANDIDTNTILTDGDTDTLKQLRQNVQNNIQDDDESIECKQLLWGNDHAVEFLQQQSNITFDLIIGSDLLYVTSVIQPLFETVRELLKPNSGKFLMAHCCRRVGNEVTLDEVLSVACDLGLDYKEKLRNDEDIVLYSFELKEK
jgi:hypothetical protein